jgi:DNA topoisomerase II
MDKKYKKHQLRDHIYELPDTYIGSVDNTSLDTYIYDDETNRMVKKNITYVPGFYKIYDEIVVNALDQVTRLKEEAKKGELENIRHVKTIKFNIDRKSGYIEIENDGDGIDIDTLPEQGGIYIPQMIFGELLTSSNYTDESVEKLVGGKNGLGSKLTNIFSLEFTVETVDHRRKKIFTQTWKDNMKTVGKPSVKAYSKVPYTKIRFLPDYKRFGLNGLTDDIYELFHKRALDACATSDASVAVYFNDKKLEIKSFEKYADLFLGDKNETTRVYESCGERWEVIAAPSASAQFEQVSFVNGINTVRGGKHVDYIKNQISKSLAEMAESKKKTVKQQHIVDNLFIIVKCLVVNPSFDTQTKEALTTPISKFGSKCELSQKFMTALYKSGIIEKAVSLTDFHQDKKAAKTDGKKTSRIIVEKLDDANEAGTKNSEDCTLILTEGDSAKALAISGLSIVGRAKYGVFPLRGKVMNVKDATAQKIADNKEITDLKKILGLQNGKVYKDLSELRYGRIMLLCDSDHDGFHIKGLLFNLFQSLWSSLYKMDNFLVSLKTPMIKAISATETVSFYTMYDAEKWIENKKKSANGLKGWTFKYYKGLGTSTAAEAKEYFKEMKITEYKYTGKDSDEALDLAFNKKRADDRKEWLMNYNPSNVLDYSKTDVKYEEFIHKELIAYSNSDLIRSINHMCDGLKDSTRKILYAAFKRKLFKKEMKVAQFGAYTAEVSDYHHGEQSLFQAIIGMAQNYVCSNNINLFAPNGQFGTRIKGGTDASAPRYIYTLLTELAQLIYPVEDFKVLEYNISDEGKKIEPKYYVPVIPMVLVNGAQGIGTGFSTNLPCYNPTDIIAHCRIIANALNTITIDKTDKLDKSDKSDKSDKLDKSDISKIIDAVKIKELTPWYLGFKGKIESKEKKEGTYESHGVYKWLNDTTIHVTELPIGTWTEDYKDFLEQCIVNNNPVLKDYEKQFTETNIDFTLKLYPGVRQGIEMNFDTEFKLISTKNLSINNIHLFTENDTIKKYANTSEIIKEFSRIRFIKYHERKEDQLKTMRKEYQIVSAKVRFIKEYINGTITLVGKKIAEVEAQLKRLNYPAIVADMIDGGDEDDDNENESSDNNNEEIIIDDKIIIDKRQPTYDYLTDLPLKTLTVEKKTALEKQENNIKMRIEELENKTLSSIWLDELSAIETAWNSFKTMIEKTHNGDHSAPALSSSSAKKRTPAKKK